MQIKHFFKEGWDKKKRAIGTRIYEVGIFHKRMIDMYVSPHLSLLFLYLSPYPCLQFQDNMSSHFVFPILTPMKLQSVVLA